MTAQEVGTKLVAYFNDNKFAEIYSELYSQDILSVEASGDEYRGMDAIHKKNEWWEANFETHSQTAEGPFPHGDQFITIYDMDVTEKASGNRFPMRETGLYTVDEGRIVEERFFYDTKSMD